MTLPPFPASAVPLEATEDRRTLTVPPLGGAPSAPPPEADRSTSAPMPVPAEHMPPRQKQALPPTDPLPSQYTDADLAAALAPLVSAPIQTSANAFPEDFEAALRSAMRRTLSQHTGSPFDQPDFLQRTVWRFDALLSSRTYDEVVQQKTGRFRIEELFLFECDRLTMISFASVEPSRHVSPKKVHLTADRIADLAREQGQPAPTSFPFKKGLQVLVRQLGELVLAAVVRGAPDRLVDADLDYALRRIETLYGKEIASGAPLLKEIQPTLEECLLIHAPLAPTSR